MRRLILTTASVLAIAIGGAGAGLAAGNTAPNANTVTGMSGTSQPAMNLSKDEIRQAQQHLRDHGLYKGAVDGRMGPETRQAIEQFQRNNGLNVTATLDQQTMDK